MSIMTNEDSAPQSTGAPTGSSQGFTGASFSGAEAAAPSGGFTFASLLDQLNISQVDTRVEPYLTEVLKIAQNGVADIKYERVPQMEGAYVFYVDGSNGIRTCFAIQFVASSDPALQNFIPQSMRLEPIFRRLQTGWNGREVRLSDARVIISDYAGDMERTEQMAACIVRTLNVTGNAAANNATVAALASSEYVASFGLSEGRKLEESLSPHGVRPRMDVSVTLSAKIQNDMGRALKDYEVTYVPFAVIGGYTEFLRQEMVNVNGQMYPKYRTVFMVTVANSNIPLEGVGALLLAALGPVIYDTKHWANQWGSLTDGESHPGLLIEDPDSPGKPFLIKNKDELVKFLNGYTTQPEIVFMYQDGRDAIPGMRRLATNDPQQRKVLNDRLSNFFNAPAEALSRMENSRVVENRYDGVYGDRNGKLIDSREVDILWALAKQGAGSMDPNVRDTLLGVYPDPAARARVIQDMVNNFSSLYMNTLAVINPGFIRTIAQLTEARGLRIVDPNSVQESRSFSSYTAGFDSSSGINSIISNGMGNRGGLGFGSVWNQSFG